MPRRSEVVARIRTVWGMGTVLYSMISTASPSGHRCDCSGYASAVWGLPTPGLSTVTLVTSGTMYELPDLDDLRPGDALAIAGPGTDGANGHIQMFESWNADNTMTIVEQGGGFGPTARRIDGPITDHRGTFKPYRLTDITEDEDMALTPEDIAAVAAATAAAVNTSVYQQPPDFANPYGFNNAQIAQGTNKGTYDVLGLLRTVAAQVADIQRVLDELLAEDQVPVPDHGHTPGGVIRG